MSFNENVIGSKGKLMSAVGSISRDSTSEYMKLYNTFSNANSAPSSGFPNANLPGLQEGVLKSRIPSDSHNMHNVKRQPSSSGGLPCGTTADARDNSVAYMDDLFAENSNSTFLSWKESFSELQPRAQIHPGGHTRSLMDNLQCEDFDFQLGPASGYCALPTSPINCDSVENSIDCVYGSSWCPASWAELDLERSNDKRGFGWARSLQDPTTEVDSLFQRSEFERPWCNRALSDGGVMASHKNVPVSNRSGPSVSDIKTSNSQSHRRRGQATSASSTSSADSSANVQTTDESRSINLPSGQSVNSADFDVATGLPDAIVRMSFIADPPSTQQSVLPSESSILGQVLPTVDKSRLLVHQMHPSFWPASSSQEGVPCSGVDPLVFNQKTDGFRRPATSDQYTQHDSLAAFRTNMSGYVKAPSAYGYDGDGLDPGQQPEGSDSRCLSDDQLWYYEDPQGRIQGEFSSSQMFSWLLAGRYFTSSLRIRRKCDDTFSTLHNYVLLFGHVPFSGTAQMPPIRGGITPELILLFRMHDQQGMVNLPFACPELQQLHKLSRSVVGDGNCVMDAPGEFEKNGLSSNAAAVSSPALLIKQLTEMITSNSGTTPVLFNNPFFSFLCEWISKAPLALQEMLSTPGFGNSVTSGLRSSPSSQPLLLTQQQQLSTRPSVEGASALPDSGIDGFLINVPQADETARSTSSDVNVPCQSVSGSNVDSHSPTMLQHKSGVGRSADGGASESEVKSKQNVNQAASSKKSSSRQKYSPTGVKPDGVEGNGGGRTISQSGCSSCSASECGGCADGRTWSNEPLLFNSSFVGGRRLDSAPEQPPLTTVKPMKKPTDKASTSVRTHVGKVEANKSPSSSTMSPSSDCNRRADLIVNCASEAPSLDIGDGTKKKAKSRRQQQATLQNGVNNSSSNGTISSRKSKNNASDNSALTEELSTLISWVQSALAGIELREKLDIPTFVELLTTIDAPYEVEGMLIAYIGNSSRSEQFVREFLDRRHTCWQLHRKRVEEMQNDSKLKEKSQNDQSTAVVSTSNECSLYAHSEANDSQTNSMWQQIKSKSSSSRRGKKKAKQRS